MDFVYQQSKQNRETLGFARYVCVTVIVLFDTRSYFRFLAMTMMMMRMTLFSRFEDVAHFRLI